MPKRPVEVPETAVAANERTLAMGQSEARAGALFFWFRLSVADNHLASILPMGAGRVRPLQVYRWADGVVPTCNVHRQELAIELDFGYELPTPGAGLPDRQADIGEERKRAPAEDAKDELVRARNLERENDRQVQ